MKIVDQYYTILRDIKSLKNMTKMLEVIGRTCYKSEDRITVDSADAFCRRLIKNEHLAMVEHEKITVKFITDRGVSHELVRHRLASFAQESTRYVNYKTGVEYIRPVFNWGSVDSSSKSEKENIVYHKWKNAMIYAESTYRDMIGLGCAPQEARAVLPNSLKTEIVVTADITEWRHILKLRTAKDAHPQIRELMLPLLKELSAYVPCLFDDLLRGK